MTVQTINPTLVAEGRTVFTVEGLSGKDVWLPKVAYPKPKYGPWSRNLAQPLQASFYQAAPDQFPYLDAAAYWDGKAWQGSASEIEKVNLPGFKRRMYGTIPGVRGRELWPDPHAVLTGLSGCNVFVDADDCPAEIVRAVDCHCTIHVWGSGNRVRCHANRALCTQVGGSVTWYFYDLDTPGSVLRVEGGGMVYRYGRASGLSVLSDAGCEYVAGRNSGSKIWGGEVVYRQKPREFAPASFTTASYLDDFASDSGLEAVAALGQFTHLGVVGGGSHNGLSDMWSDSGKTVWVEDRSKWEQQIKDWGITQTTPTGNVLPGGE